MSKVQIATKTHQTQVTLTLKEAQILSENLGFVLSRALGNLDKAYNQTGEQDDGAISIQMDGGGF